MSLQIRRGTAGQRTGITPDVGEPIWVSDTQKLYIGDGTTAGGVNILAASAGQGLTWNNSTQAFDFTGSGLSLTTDNVNEGTVRQYFTAQRAQDAAAAMLTAVGSPNITGTITGLVGPDKVTVGSTTNLAPLAPFIVLGTGGSGLTTGTYYITSIVDSTRIKLSTSLANAQAGVFITSFTTASLSTTTFQSGGPDSNIAFVYNPTNHTLSANVTLDGVGIATVSADITPTLGGDLGLAGKQITGNGNINITGQIYATPISTTASATASDTITLASVTNMRVNMPIVFMLTSQTASSFGNIVPYRTYYIRSVSAPYSITLSTTIGGSLFAAGTGTGTLNVLANGVDTGIVTSSALNVSSMLNFADIVPGNTAVTGISQISGLLVFGQASQPGSFVFNTDTSGLTQPFCLRGVTTGFSQAQPTLKLGASRGTLPIPTVVQNGDSIGLIKFDAYTGINQMAGLASGAFISAYITDTGTLSNAVTVDTTIAMGNINSVGTGKYMTLDPKGVLSVPTVKYGLEVITSVNYIAVSATGAQSLSATITDNVLINAASGYTVTINMPATPQDGQICRFAIASNNCTLALGTGTVIGSFVGAVTAPTAFRYIYRLSNTSWYRI